MSDQRPSVGRVVHYVSYGTPGGEHRRECRAATITEVGGWVTIETVDRPFQQRTLLQNYVDDAVGLAVLNPTGEFFNTPVQYDGGEDYGGDSDPLAGRMCDGRRHRGGTWHWPARV
jgi:hypothetical protein